MAAAVTELSGYAVTKMSAKREGASTKALAREALHDRLEAIGLTARALAPHTPGLRDKFRMPDPLTDQTRLRAGRLFARDAEGFRDQFRAHGTPPTFIRDLTALVEAFEEAIQEREEGRGGQTAARASIVAALASGTALGFLISRHWPARPSSRRQRSRPSPSAMPNFSSGPLRTARSSCRPASPTPATGT